MDFIKSQLSEFMERLGLEEEPMGLYYSNDKPAQGFAPKKLSPVSRDSETKGEIDWESILSQGTCIIKEIRRARMERSAAYFSDEHFGCVGAAFYLGFTKPYLNVNPYLVSEGIPGVVDGERYVKTAEKARELFDAFEPVVAPAKYLIVKPLGDFDTDQKPEIVFLFARPETISGLTHLTCYVTNDLESIQTPISPGCGSIISWPRLYMERNKKVAVVGCLDPTCRIFLKRDELSFAVSYELFVSMLQEWKDSFLTTQTWRRIRKRIKLSSKRN